MDLPGTNPLDIEELKLMIEAKFQTSHIWSSLLIIYLETNPRYFLQFLTTIALASGPLLVADQQSLLPAIATGQLLVAKPSLLLTVIMAASGLL